MSNLDQDKIDKIDILGYEPPDVDGDKSSGHLFSNKQLITTPHDRKIEWIALIGTGVVIFFSFLSIGLAAFIPFNNSVQGGKAKEQLVSFASSTGTTALGALVAVLARKRRSD